MNVVTGIFVEHATQTADRDLDKVIHEEMTAQKSYQEGVLRMFHEADIDQSGTLTMDEFENHMQELDGNISILYHSEYPTIWRKFRRNGWLARRNFDSQI